MGRVVTNDVTAITPELWESQVQIPLRKMLVSIEVANTRLSDNISRGDTVHMPYYGDLSAQTYTPGTPLSATNLDWKFDTLVVSTYKHATFYIDDVEKLQSNVSQQTELTEEAAYQLSNRIDQDTFKGITGSDGFNCVDAADMQGGTANRPVTASSSQIIEIFSNATRKLRENNVEEMGDWCAVITPKIGFYLENKATNVGYDVADSTLRNGYMGNFMGYQLYISNNLPSGKCSAIAPGDKGGPSATAASATSCKSIYFGRKGTIDLAIKSPTLTIRKCEDKLGFNFITWTVYGKKVFTKNQSRGINCAVQSGFY